jgi:hypothetical protein
MIDRNQPHSLSDALQKYVLHAVFPPCTHGWGLVFLFLLLAIQVSCAPKSRLETPEAPSFWITFQRQQKTLKPLEDFSIKTSINYSSREHRHRMIMRLFGSLDYPIRMDLEAGIGRTISMWREDATIWQAYFPEEKKMYTAADAKFGVQSLGFPCPFDLRELSLVMQGKLSTILPEQPVREKLQKTGGRIFFAPSDRMASLLVDSRGRALELVGNEGWRVVFDYQNASLYNQKISMIMDDSTRAVIRVKSIGPGHFTTDLAIELPDDTETIAIAPSLPIPTDETDASHDSRTKHPRN